MEDIVSDLLVSVQGECSRCRRLVLLEFAVCTSQDMTFSICRECRDKFTAACSLAGDGEAYKISIDKTLLRA